MENSAVVPVRPTHRPPSPGTRGDSCPVFQNPVLDAGDDVDHGDPYVMEFGGEFFLYHSGPTGIDAYRSEDMVSWSWAGTVLTGAGEGHWAQVELWAPEVVFFRGEFLMYVAATCWNAAPDGRPSGKAQGSNGGDDAQRRQGVARATSPLGPFVWDDAPLVDEWSIDAHPFIDDDGRRWLFYNVRNEDTRHASGVVGCGNVVDELDAGGTLVGMAAPVVYPSEPWESGLDGQQYWNEAPCTLKRRGRYYQMYSGGFFGGDGYAIGVAVADDIVGPWRKESPVPIFASGEKITGPGHHCVVLAPDGVTPYAVYHGYVEEFLGRKVHMERLYWVGDRPQLGRGVMWCTSPTQEPQASPPRAVVDPGVSAFALRAWVRGGRALVAGVPVELADPGVHLVEALYDGTVLQLRCDVTIVHRSEGDAFPTLEGVEVLFQVVASHRDDQKVYELKEGEVLRLPWGGKLPVEASVAVRGSAHLELGTNQWEVDSAAFELALLHSEVGAEEFVVRAGPGGVTVTDVVLDAR